MAKSVINRIERNHKKCSIYLSATNDPHYALFSSPKTPQKGNFYNSE